MKTIIIAFVSVVTLAAALSAAEFHVATNGNDAHRGTPAAPLRTIQRAAHLAKPGDVITVHAGTYRERITPPRGGVPIMRISGTNAIVHGLCPDDWRWVAKYTGNWLRRRYQEQD